MATKLKSTNIIFGIGLVVLLLIGFYCFYKGIGMREGMDDSKYLMMDKSKSYTVYPDKNTYNMDNGSRYLDGDPSAYVDRDSIDGCLDWCSSYPDNKCECAVYEPATKKCFRRTNCVPSKFSDSQLSNVYVLNKSEEPIEDSPEEPIENSHCPIGCRVSSEGNESPPFPYLPSDQSAKSECFVWNTYDCDFLDPASHEPGGCAEEINPNNNNNNFGKTIPRGCDISLCGYAQYDIPGDRKTTCPGLMERDTRIAGSGTIKKCGEGKKIVGELEEKIAPLADLNSSTGMGFINYYGPNMYYQPPGMNSFPRLSCVSDANPEKEWNPIAQLVNFLKGVERPDPHPCPPGYDFCPNSKDITPSTIDCFYEEDPSKTCAPPHYEDISLVDLNPHCFRIKNGEQSCLNPSVCGPGKQLCNNGYTNICIDENSVCEKEFDTCLPGYIENKYGDCVIRGPAPGDGRPNRPGGPNMTRRTK